MSDTTDVYSYIPAWLQGTALGEVFAQVWDETGSYQAAIDAVRADGSYAEVFAGNLREDGSVRLTESEYLSDMESFSDSLVAVGISREFIEANLTDDFVGLIEGNVRGDEFWRDMVQPMWDRVINASDSIRAEYAGTTGEALSDEEIFMSLFKPDLSGAILERDISMAEIRGAYRERFTDIDNVMTNYFDELYERGDIDLNAARALFTNADTMMPTISALAARHADPDDDFDIYEFTAASLVTDPLQASRMRRLMGQERASFQKASSQVDTVRDERTGAIGLLRR